MTVGTGGAVGKEVKRKKIRKKRKKRREEKKKKIFKKKKKKYQKKIQKKNFQKKYITINFYHQKDSKCDKTQNLKLDKSMTVKFFK